MPANKKRLKCDPQWFYNIDGGWEEFAETDAAMIERLFGSKSKVVATTDLSFNKKHKSVYEFDFKKMKQTNRDSNNTRKIKRVDPTEQSDSEEDDDSDSDDAEYTWEHQDNFGVWVALYDEDNELVESLFAKKTKKGQTFKTKELTFNQGYNSQYIFDFDNMTQRNSDSGTVRNIRRSKNVQQVWNVKNYGVKKETLSKNMKLSGDILATPDTWDPTSKKSPAVDLFKVSPSSKEYTNIVQPFFKTFGHGKSKPTIKSLTRIQNYQLWPFYALNRDKIEKKNTGKGGANEMFLFHGARVKQNMDAIINSGFDTRVAANGLCGTGTYFAVNSSYSDSGYVYRHKDGSKEMLVCRVLVGRYTVKQGNDRRPPPLDPKKPNDGLYDSVVDTINQPVMHVVFYDHQAVPEYLIHYN